MKKLLLLSLLIIPSLNAQPHHFKAITYIERLKEVISDTKELIKAHPFISLTITTATLAAIYWYTKDDGEDVSWEAYEHGEPRPVGWYKINRPAGFFGKTKTPSPQASPNSSVTDFKDFTGDFPPTARSNLHPTELRHK